MHEFPKGLSVNLYGTIIAKTSWKNQQKKISSEFNISIKYNTAIILFVSLHVRFSRLTLLNAC